MQILSYSYNYWCLMKCGKNLGSTRSIKKCGRRYPLDSLNFKNVVKCYHKLQELCYPLALWSSCRLILVIQLPTRYAVRNRKQLELSVIWKRFRLRNNNDLLDMTTVNVMAMDPYFLNWIRGRVAVDTTGNLNSMVAVALNDRKTSNKCTCWCRFFCFLKVIDEDEVKGIDFRHISKVKDSK